MEFRVMETPVQSEKVREKAHQLCKEYLQVRGCGMRTRRGLCG